MDIWVDNRYFFVEQNYTIFQFCSKIGISLPNFCYHERLSIAGNCRICLCEANSALVISCATILLDKMNIYTRSKRIKKAREGVLEFLLANHPLDCPICDQGGACDLQDIFLIYGSDRGRFYELNKRSVTNLQCLGPFVKTIMTRCIHCTRCVRFVNEISSNFNFGIIGRGYNMEIGTYIQNFINDELVSNIIDLCPVGALISMPNSFVNRNWELKYIKSVDCLDIICANIRLAIVNNNIIRILPSIDEYYNEWITNKSRFIYDSFNIQRLYYPKIKLNFKFIILSWKLALLIFINLLIKNFNKFINIICGSFINLELCLIIKSFFLSYSCNNINYYELTKIMPEFRFTYLLNYSFIHINNLSSIFLIGSNPRIEAPLYNVYIRKSFLNNNKLKIYSLGINFEYLAYPIINLGCSIKNYINIINGLLLVNKYFLFNNYYNYYLFLITKIITLQIIFGNSIFNRIDSNSIYNILIYLILKLNIKYNINFLQRNVGRINYLEIYVNTLNIYKKKKNNFYMNYLIGIDNYNLYKKNYNIFQGFFYISNLFKQINLIFPTSIYVEQATSYINLEGRYRYTNKIITPYKFIFMDQNIIKSFSIFLIKLYINNFSIIYNFYKITKFFIKIINYYKSYLIKFQEYIIKYKNDLFIKNIKFKFNINFFNNKIFNTLFSKTIYNFYSSDIFSKKSKIMIIASKKVKIINF